MEQDTEAPHKGAKNKYNHVNNQALIGYIIIYHLDLHLIASAPVQWTCWWAWTQNEQATPSNISRPRCCFSKAWPSTRCGFCERGLAAQVVLPTSSPLDQICAFGSIRASGKAFPVLITGRLLFRGVWQSHKRKEDPAGVHLLAGTCSDDVERTSRHQVLLKGSPVKRGFSLPMPLVWGSSPGFLGLFWF